MTIPLVRSGAEIGLYFTGMTMSFFGTLGMISLAGIVANNPIVLINQIDIERSTQSVEDAILAASKKRVTPILLTILTTDFGLVPMAIVGGLVCAAPLTLILVPSLYLLFFTD